MCKIGGCAGKIFLEIFLYLSSARLDNIQKLYFIDITTSNIMS